MTKNTSHSSPGGRTPEPPPSRRTSTPESRRRSGGRVVGGGQGAAERLSTTSVAADSDRGETYLEPSWEEIANRAYFRFLERGGDPGRDQEDWLEAERELRNGH